MPGKPPFAHVMLLLDGTEISLRAADYALALCECSDARLSVLAVVDTDTLRHLLGRRIIAHAEMGEIEAELERFTRKQLDHVSRLAGERNIPLHATLAKGALRGAVLEAVGRLKADLVVMGGYTSSIVRRDLAAYERQGVVDELHIPVVLVK